MAELPVELVGQTGDVAADLLDRRSSAQVDALDLSLDGVGHPQNLVADALDGLGRALLGLADLRLHGAQPTVDTRLARANRSAGIDPAGHMPQLVAHIGERSLLGRLVLIDLGGDPAERCLQALQRLGDAAGGRIGLALLGEVDACGQATDALVDAGDRQGRTGFGRLDARRQPLDRLVERGGLWQRGDLALALIFDDVVQPLAERHAGASREILGGLAGLAVDPLHAPRDAAGHPNQLSYGNAVSGTLATDPLCVNAALTLHLASATGFCGRTTPRLSSARDS